MHPSRTYAIVEQLLIAVIFCGMAALSLNLGVYPIMTRPIWLPAALLAALVYCRGSKDLPGLMLGAGLFGAWRYWETQQTMGFVVNAICVFVQVVCANALLTRFLGPADAPRARELSTSRDVAITAVVLGPIMMSLKPVVIFPFLLWYGLIPNQWLWDRALDWVVIDVMAFVLVAPMLMVLIGQPRAWWRTRRASLLLMQSVIVAGFIGFLQLAALTEKRTLESQLRAELKLSLSALLSQLQDIERQSQFTADSSWLSRLPSWVALTPVSQSIRVPSVVPLYLDLAGWQRAEAAQRFASRQLRLSDPLDVPSSQTISVVETLRLHDAQAQIALSVSDVYLRAMVSGSLRLFQLAMSLTAVFATLLTLLASGRRRALETLVDKRTEELAAQTQQLRLFQSLVNQASEAVLAGKINSGKSTSLSVAYCNPALERITGYSMDEVMSYSPERGAVVTGPNTDREKHRLLVQKLAQGQSARVEMWHYKKDGTPFWASISAFPIFDDQGKITHVGGFYRDESARRAEFEDRLETQRRRQSSLHDEQLGRMAGGIAHDMNNLLGAVSGGTELLRQSSHDPTVLGILSDIEHAADHASELAEQLLALASGVAAAPVTMDLAKRANALLRLLRLSIDSRIALRLSVSAEQACIRMDQGQLTRVLLNTVVNAAQAMPENQSRPRVIELKVHYHATRPGLGDSVVLIDAQDIGAWVEIAIADAGVGIAPNILSGILMPSFTTKASGTGLGLASVAEIIREQRGMLWVQSQLETGTTMRVMFPAVDAAEAIASTPSDAIQTPAQSRILVCDDDDNLRSFVSSALTSEGYPVVSCGDGEAALALLKKHRFEVIISDIAMPILDGYGLINALSQLAKPPKLLIMTGYQFNEAMLDPSAVRPVRILQKPLHSATLIDAVSAALS